MCVVFHPVQDDLAQVPVSGQKEIFVHKAIQSAGMRIHAGFLCGAQTLAGNQRLSGTLQGLLTGYDLPTDVQKPAVLPGVYPFKTIPRRTVRLLPVGV